MEMRPLHCGWVLFAVLLLSGCSGKFPLNTGPIEVNLLEDESVEFEAFLLETRDIELAVDGVENGNVSVVIYLGSGGFSSIRIFGASLKIQSGGEETLTRVAIEYEPNEGFVGKEQLRLVTADGLDRTAFITVSPKN